MKGKYLLRIGFIVIKFALCFFIWFTIWWISEIIPWGINRYIVEFHELSVRTPEIVFDIIYDGVNFPAWVVFDRPETLTIFGSDVIEYNSQLAIIHGTIQSDGIEYEYLLPVRRIPFTSRYALNRRHHLIMSSSGLNVAEMMFPPSFLVSQFPGIWNTLIILNRNEKTISGNIRPPNPVIMMGGLAFSYLCTRRTWRFRRNAKSGSVPCSV